MAPTILITGFGPFPGMPVNPTEKLAARLARTRRPSLAGVRRAVHVFPTSYAAVDRELPELLRRHRPDALLMFGVAGRTRHIRIETLARNRLSLLLPDVAGVKRAGGTITTGAASAVPLRTPALALLAATRRTRLPVAHSRDAGRYLCNYLCWQAMRLAIDGKPKLVAFVHVPKAASPGRRSGPLRALTFGDLVRAGEAILAATAAELARR